MKTHLPIHPGEVLREDFLVPPRCINEIVKGKRSITALRLGRFFVWPAVVWLNLQSSHGRQTAEIGMRGILARIRPCAALAAATA